MTAHINNTLQIDKKHKQHNAKHETHHGHEKHQKGKDKVNTPENVSENVQ